MYVGLNVGYTVLPPATDAVIVLVVMLLIPIVTGPFMFTDPDVNNDPVIITD